MAAGKRENVLCSMVDTVRSMLSNRRYLTCILLFSGLFSLSCTIVNMILGIGGVLCFAVAALGCMLLISSVEVCRARAAVKGLAKRRYS